jgi:2-keto-4-pentenoate hydratase/2-oxohepta-3-ene-1,7-dioic acid hydratase in catechol pathway
MYQHQTIYQQLIGLPVGKVVCVGRNYAEHAKELGNEIPITPILFLKPSTSIVCLEDGFSIPTDQGCVHHEAEISLLVDKRTKNISAEQAWSSVSHVGLALDLTLRDLQSKLKEKSHPWEIAKAFDGACPLSKWIPVAELSNKEDIAISLEKDGELKQVGSSMQMITNIPQLIAYMSNIFTLMPGDVIITVTPSGVGPLKSGDQLKAVLDNKYTFKSNVL